MVRSINSGIKIFFHLFKMFGLNADGNVPVMNKTKSDEVQNNDPSETPVGLIDFMAEVEDYLYSGGSKPNAD